MGRSFAAGRKRNGRSKIMFGHRPAVARHQPRGCGVRGDVGRVESECGAAAVGPTYLLPPLSSGGASLVRPWLRFHTPLIERSRRISRTALSDKTSRLHPRRAAAEPGQTYEPEVPVEVREWIAPALASPALVLEPQPPAQPHS